MASSKIAANGTEVILRMNFTEAAAVMAVLQRIDADTNTAIADATMDAWAALNDLSDKLREKNLWPGAFDVFGAREKALVDPQATWED